MATCHLSVRGCRYHMLETTGACFLLCSTKWKGVCSRMLASFVKRVSLVVFFLFHWLCARIPGTVIRRNANMKGIL